MPFFMSGEVSVIVQPAFGKVLREVEKPFGDWLKIMSLGDYDIAFIPIILTPRFRIAFPEIRKYNAKTKTIELRVHVNHAKFKNAGHNERVALLFGTFSNEIFGLNLPEPS